MNEFFEEERHRCEVRFVIKIRMQDRIKMLEYLELVKEKRGKEKYEKLEKDARDQWAKGNRANHGEWII